MSASHSSRKLREKSPYFNEKDPPQLQLRHDLVRAKIAAYTYQNNPQRVLRQYSDNSLPSRYARAIVAFHTGGISSRGARAERAYRRACRKIPGFMNSRAHFCWKAGTQKMLLRLFERQFPSCPRSGFMRIELAQAILESGGGSPEEALKMLR